MKCTPSNGYVGWRAIERASGVNFQLVLWVDPHANTICSADLQLPLPSIGVDPPGFIYQAHHIEVDHTSKTFWVTADQGRAVTVAPLSPGRQSDQEPSGKPCADCCQEATCRRLDYCAAHRRGFGERAP